METRPERSLASEEEHARDAWWSTLASLYRRRRLILGLTGFAAVASVVISLLLPNWYQATARVIMPAGSGGGGLSALIGNLDPTAAALIGGVGGDYIRYMAILTSNNMKDRVIDEFNLMEEYETADSQTPVRDTRKKLDDNLEMEVDVEYDFLSISALDKDPAQAAAMANFIVNQLNEMNIELATESARTYRRFVQRRYDETVASLDSAMAALQKYQEQYGLIELEQQSKAFLEVLAEYRAAAFQSEVEYQALVLDFGEDNPMVQSARHRVTAARAKEHQLIEGKDPLMPVALSDLPEVGKGYAEALRDVTINQKILEFARPLLEQAVFEEQRQAPAVQWLDHAKVPEWKTYPKRSLIVLGATVSVFILVVLYVVLMGWLARNKSYFMSRIDRELNRGS